MPSGDLAKADRARGQKLSIQELIAPVRQASDLPDHSVSWHDAFASLSIYGRLELMSLAELESLLADPLSFERNPRLHNHIEYQLLKKLAAQDPEEALNRVLDNPSSTRGWQLKGVLNTIADSDPVYALQLCADPNLGLPVRANNEAAIYEQWARADPQAALAHLDQHAGPLVRPKMRSAVIGGWLIASPVSLVDHISKNGTGDLELPDSWATSSWLDKLTPAFDGDPQRAADWLKENAIVPAAEIDRWKAIESVKEIPLAESVALFEKQPDRKLEVALASEFARRDPAEGYALLAAMPENTANRHLILRFCDELCARSPDEAIALINSGDSPHVSKELIDKLVYQQSAEGIEGIQSVLDSFETESTKQSYLEVAIPRMAQLDPLVAMESLGQFQTGDTRSKIAEKAIRAWGNTSPREALEWAAAHAETVGLVGDNWVPRILDDWVETDPYDASEWISGMENGFVRDRSVHDLVDAIHETDPESAATWADTISEPRIRLSSLIDAMQSHAKNGGDVQALREKLQLNDEDFTTISKFLP